MKYHLQMASLIPSLMIVLPAPAAAQAPREQNVFIRANMGVQPSARTFQLAATPVVYGENAILNSLEGVDGSAMLDLQGGYRVHQRFWIALGLTTTMSTKSEARVVEQIPDPLLYDRLAGGQDDLTDLTHKERSAHLSMIWEMPVSARLDASVLGGPSYIKVFQDFIQNVEVTPGTQNATPVPNQATATTMGFHVGGDMTYALSPMFGLGGMARYVFATAELPSAVDLKVGGFQYGGTLRVRF